MHLNTGGQGRGTAGDEDSKKRSDPEKDGLSGDGNSQKRRGGISRFSGVRTVKYSDSYGHQQVRRCQYRGLCFFQFQLCAGYEPGGGG